MSTGYRLPPIKWLMAFEASARQMSFTAAAAELVMAIERCADLCAEHFPVQPRRSDQLSNALRTID